jgi:hypothetical protein
VFNQNKIILNKRLIYNTKTLRTLYSLAPISGNSLIIDSQCLKSQIFNLKLFVQGVRINKYITYNRKNNLISGPYFSSKLLVIIIITKLITKTRTNSSLVNTFLFFKCSLIAGNTIIKKYEMLIKNNTKKINT